MSGPKLSHEQRMAIFIRRHNGEKCLALAAEFGVTESTISRVSLLYKYKFLIEDGKNSIIADSAGDRRRKNGNRV